MKIEIKCRFSGKILFETEAESIRAAVEIAVSKKVILNGANLGGANLEDAYLRGANLEDAYLRGANLGGANLGDAYLRGANLGGADLGGADLRGANLGDAYLRGANLEDANLGGANLGDANLGDAYLRGANLEDANLGGADIRGANLEEIKKDFLAVLTAAKNEVVGLYRALLEGRVDGRMYEGECCCLKGTIANVRGCSFKALGEGVLEPRASSPAERWFTGIFKGDTPANNQISAITKEWTEEFMKENGIPVPVMTVSWVDASGSRA